MKENKPAVVRSNNRFRLKDLITPHYIEIACRWAIQNRKNFPDSDSIWDVVFKWKVEKNKILSRINSSNYLFEVTFNQQGIINLAKKTEIQFKFKLSQLYEQPVKKASYIKAFYTWVKGFMDDLAKVFLSPIIWIGFPGLHLFHPGKGCRY